jgi:hypothetical protein
VNGEAFGFIREVKWLKRLGFSTGQFWGSKKRLGKEIVL